MLENFFNVVLNHKIPVELLVKDYGKYLLSRKTLPEKDDIKLTNWFLGIIGEYHPCSKIYGDVLELIKKSDWKYIKDEDVMNILINKRSKMYNDKKPLKYNDETEIDNTDMKNIKKPLNSKHPSTRYLFTGLRSTIRDIIKKQTI
eukprot:UN25531